MQPAHSDTLASSAHSDSWYVIGDTSGIASPALLIYPERVQHNIQTLLAMAGGNPVRLRPHVKTSKAAEPIRLLLNAGITTFKAATIAEAELLAMEKAPDLLLAYQPVGPAITRLLALEKKYPATRFSCLVDNPALVPELAAAAKNAGTKLELWIDLNVGMNRTGIDVAGSLPLYETICREETLLFRGLHAYDGHLHDPSLETRKLAVEAAFRPVDELRAQLTVRENRAIELIAGGTPSFPIHLQHEDRVCSPGTFVYWDQNYLSYTEQPFQPAALLLCRVVSFPTATRVCVDLGHKAVAAENDISRRVYFLNAPQLMPVGQSEEHLVLEAGEGHAFKIGDILYGLPWHVCPTVALHESAITIEQQHPTGSWVTVARKRKISI